jgi:hypothetical protein
MLFNDSFETCGIAKKTIGITKKDYAFCMPEKVSL